jgi:hypothetical protein
MSISLWILLRLRNILDTNCTDNQNTHFMFNTSTRIRKHSPMRAHTQKYITHLFYTATVASWTHLSTTLHAHRLCDFLPLNTDRHVNCAQKFSFYFRDDPVCDGNTTNCRETLQLHRLASLHKVTTGFCTIKILHFVLITRFKIPANWELWYCASKLIIISFKMVSLQQD